MFEITWARLDGCVLTYRGSSTFVNIIMREARKEHADFHALRVLEDGAFLA